MDNLSPIFEHNNKSYPIEFTWGKLIKLKEALGEEYLKKIGSLITENGPDTQTIVTTLSVGTGIKYGDLLNCTDPITEIIEKITLALRLSINGPFKETDSPEKKKVAVDAS